MCNLADYPDKLGPHGANSDSAPAWRYVFFDFFSSRFFSPGLPQPLSIPSSLEQARFRVLLSPKPFSFGWSLKDSDNQRWEARRPAGEGAQEAGQIYWAASAGMHH